MKLMATPSPKTLTIYGRLSFPTWTAAEAYALSQKGNYPAADVASAAPHFQLLVSATQWEKFLKHATEVFLPYCLEQSKKGDKKDALDAKDVAALAAGLEGDLADQPYNTPAKPVHEKTAPLVPDAVAAIKCIGQKGTDIELKAIVNDESELSVPDPDLISFPVIKPIGATVHQMYPGAFVAATLNLYAYRNGKHPGFSAGVSTAVFKMDGDRIGGSVSVDEDAIFMD
jgi:hypothetical protein